MKKITISEKEKLKKRIHSSIVRYERNRLRKKRYSYVMAVAALFILSLAVGFFMNSEKTLNNETYLHYEKSLVVGDQVQLILGDKQAIAIEEDEPNIVYSDSGQEVYVENSQKTQDHKLSEGFNTIMVPYGKRSMVTLSENTKVWLNSGSKLIYPNVFKGDRREVFLVGEAIFDVSHNEDKPFIVKTSNCDITVLGTIFNVSSYPDDEYVSTTLKQGSIAVDYPAKLYGTSTLKITPGTQFIYLKSENSIESRQVNTLEYMSWKEGYFVFKNQRLEEILKKLSRYYAIPITIRNEEMEDLTFSGNLDLKEDIEKVLEVIQATSDFSFYKSGNKIIIN